MVRVNQADRVGPRRPAILGRVIGDEPPRLRGPASREGVVLGDNLEVLRSLPDACIDLIYVDPPFGTGQRAASTSSAPGRATAPGRLRRPHLPMGDGLLPRVPGRHGPRRLPRLPGPPPRRDAPRAHRAGSLYVHLDHHAVHHVRLLWTTSSAPNASSTRSSGRTTSAAAPTTAGPASTTTSSGTRGRRAGPSTPTRWTAPLPRPGLVGPEKSARGKLPTDVWWMTIVPTPARSAPAIRRRSRCACWSGSSSSSNPGDLVADFFGGSVTTAVAASRLGRRYLAVDNNPEAVRITGSAGRLATPPARRAEVRAARGEQKHAEHPCGCRRRTRHRSSALGHTLDSERHRP